MAERDIRIDGPDGNGIYGTLTAGGNRRLVFHIHGLTHQPGYLLEVTSSEFFEAHGFDHYRIGLYTTMPDSRKLHQSTLATHARDIGAALDHFRGAYDEIFITAHSLAAPALLILNPAGIRAISFWDPATDVTHFWNSGPFLAPVPERRQYLLDYGNIFVLSADMVDEIARYPDAKCRELAARMTTPAQFIIPGQSIFLASPHIAPENYREAFAGPFELARIAGANHRFSGRGSREALFAATLGFFEKQS